MPVAHIEVTQSFAQAVAQNLLLANISGRCQLLNIYVNQMNNMDRFQIQNWLNMNCYSSHTRYLARPPFHHIACVPVTEHIEVHLYPILIHMEFPFINQLQFTVIFYFATGSDS